ncbi:MAG: DUF421 domain-containing protein [Actinobacteria bacterium]|nr:MAG: DUF421 domain-containing protein [Actinomycetota bacterium]
MQIAARASVMFVFLFIVMRSMGRKELAELSAFELILIIVMGDLIQQGVTQQDNSLTGAITAISTFVVWMLALSYLSFKSKRARTIIEGRPVIVIRDGEPQEKILRYERLSFDEITDAAREQGIADLRDVQVGVLESDGSFSFIRYKGGPTAKKPEKKAVD